MKKLLSLSLALLMLISSALLSACSSQSSSGSSALPSSTVSSVEDSQTVTVSSSEDPSSKETLPSPVSSSGSQSTSSEPEPYDIPESYSLKGTKHLPIVDNQGNIGSCTSEGITYAQFTVAVSQYMNKYYPDIEWDPSSGDARYIFSPKFSYNYTAGNTNMCYRILVDDGALPMSISCFEKTTNFPGFWGSSILNSAKTRSWDVEEGMMYEALNYRLTNFEEQNAPSKITGDDNSAFINKVKTAISMGNVVTVCGAAYNWRSTVLGEQPENCLAKTGENVIWRSGTLPSSGPSGHCVALVGYDDNVTLTVGGVEMKGAFLMMNSWGRWMNDGFVWVMYDACNLSSDYAPLNTDVFNGALALGSRSLNFRRVVDKMDEGYVLSFTCSGQTEIAGESYPTYYIKNTTNEKYLSVRSNSLEYVDQADDSCLFALPPYNALATADDAIYNKDNVLVLYAVNARGAYHYVKCDGTGMAPVMTNSLTDAGRVTYCLTPHQTEEDGSFEAILYTKNIPTPMSFTREQTFGSYGFVYWDKDVTVGSPMISVEVKVEILNRKNLYIILHRTDADGNQETYIPAMMQIRINESAQPETGGGTDRISFSGIINPTERESGYFSFGYLPLTTLGKGMTLEDYMWGVTVTGPGIIVQQIRLIDQNGKEIACVKPDTDVEPLVKGQSTYYALQLQSEVKSAFGVGTFSLTHKDEGKTMSLSKNNMTFDWVSNSLNNQDKCGFRMEYVEKENAYRIWNYADTYLWDIAGSHIKEDVIFKLNKENEFRNTQLWVIDEKDGYLRIALKADPSYVANYKNGAFCITQLSEKEGYVWAFGAASPIDMPVTVHQNGDKVVLTLKKPAEYTTGTVQIRISSEGTLVDTLEKTPTDEGTTIELTLTKGQTYLFTVYYNGLPTGLQIGYKVA